MRYHAINRGFFVERPNRFIAIVRLDGVEHTVHVKNTGRCRELLLPGAEVLLEHSENPNRKTAYDLVGVYKEGIGWINIDSQAPNQVVKEWLLGESLPCFFAEEGRQITYLKPEYTYGKSRIDFYLEYQDQEKQQHKVLMEVKGVTMEREHIAYFPDAPTERGVKHMRELAAAVAQGYECYSAFVIQMEGVDRVYANVEMHPEFGAALEDARHAGVQVLALGCAVTEDTLQINRIKRM